MNPIDLMLLGIAISLVVIVAEPRIPRWAVNSFHRFCSFCGALTIPRITLKHRLPPSCH